MDKTLRKRIVDLYWCMRETPDDTRSICTLFLSDLINDRSRNVFLQTTGDRIWMV